MKHYLHTNDIVNPQEIIREAILLKMNPYEFQTLGKNKTLVLLFFNASLRTRLSTEKAARNLGMEVIVLNVDQMWNLEFEDGSIMKFNTSEHIKEGAKVISQYADIIGVRAFPTLTDKLKDESEYIIHAFSKYATVPIISLESATAHPLQALADAITITELANKPNPKVVLSWAPHPKALPQAVANSFVQMIRRLEVDLYITHPQGYDLNSSITDGLPISNDQEETLKNADFVYVKNWSSYTDYGKILSEETHWMMTKTKLGEAKFMHCLPVRRNVVVTDDVLDSESSVVLQQANNRTFAAQIILKQILDHLNS